MLPGVPYQATDFGAAPVSGGSYVIAGGGQLLDGDGGFAGPPDPGGDGGVDLDFFWSVTVDDGGNSQGLLPDGGEAATFQELGPGPFTVGAGSYGPFPLSPPTQAVAVPLGGG